MFEISGFYRDSYSIDQSYVDFGINPEEEIDSQNVLSHIAHLRLKKMEDDVNIIAKEMGIDQKIKLLVNKDKIHDLSLKTSAININSETAAIYVSELFFLVNLDDFPENLKPSGKNDPRLHSDDYLKEVSCWVRTFLGVDCNSPGLNSNQKKNMMIYLMLISTVALFPRARDFVLRHEMGHILCKHIQEDARNHDHFLRAGFGTMLLGSVSYFFNSGYQLGDMNLSFTFIVLIISHFVIANSFFQSRSISHEYEADRIAGLKEREGGIYFFKTYQLCNLNKSAADDRDANWISKISKIGEKLGDFFALRYHTHPSDALRIRHLQQLSKDNS